MIEVIVAVLIPSVVVVEVIVVKDMFCEKTANASIAAKHVNTSNAYRVPTPRACVDVSVFFPCINIRRYFFYIDTERNATERNADLHKGSSRFSKNQGTMVRGSEHNELRASAELN